MLSAPVHAIPPHPTCFFPSSLTWKKSITVRSRKSTEIIFAVITQLWQPLTFYNSFWTWLFLNETLQSPWVTVYHLSSWGDFGSSVSSISHPLQFPFINSSPPHSAEPNNTSLLPMTFPVRNCSTLLWRAFCDLLFMTLILYQSVLSLRWHFCLLDVQNRAPFGWGLWELTDHRMQHAGGCCHMVKGNAWKEMAPFSLVLLTYYSSCKHSGPHV